jgi:hypothetical protein
MSMNVCNITILGLPTVLTGHIMPDMTTTSLLESEYHAKQDAKYYSMMINAKLFTMVMLFLQDIRIPSATSGHC